MNVTITVPINGPTLASADAIGQAVRDHIVPELRRLQVLRGSF